MNSLQLNLKSNLFIYIYIYIKYRQDLSALSQFKSQQKKKNLSNSLIDKALQALVSNIEKTASKKLNDTCKPGWFYQPLIQGLFMNLYKGGQIGLNIFS